LVSALAAAAILLALPASVGAASPIKSRFLDELDFVDTSCGFPIRIELHGLSSELDWVDEDGELVRFILTVAGRPYEVSLTNLDTEETVTLNISGPVFFEFEPDGSRTGITSGPFLLFYRPESITLPLVPWLYYFAGHRVLTVAADGTRSVTWQGRFVDLCARLAA
jgi:hypothetical protein